MVWPGGGDCQGSTVTLLRNRERGAGPRHATHAPHFDRMAEDRAAHYHLEETECKLPSSVRSTFLMAFSPDCTKVASTHGDHRIYVCEVSTGQLAHTLEGHPRTPWCLAFHPSSNYILASGCLGGEVRVWDLRGGSEVWTSPQNSVISSLAFHPTEPLLAIATGNGVHLWDWRRGRPLATCRTASEREKVRFVQFCPPCGDSLVTGITNVSVADGASAHGSASSTPTRRRSILGRLMSMYQRLEGLEELSSYHPTAPPVESQDVLQQARDYARDVTELHRLQQLEEFPFEPEAERLAAGSSLTEEDPESESQRGGSSILAQSRDFWATFQRLRCICSRLERRMQQHQQRSHAELVRHTPPAAVSTPRPSSSSRGEEGSPSRTEGGNREVSLSLVSLLTRLQLSLQSLSSAALTTAVARDQIHQVRLRITEILERLANVSGYRARLTSLRDQIYEAERMARRGEEEGSPSQHWDLAYCLWLVEMSLQLTRQMQRILAADYRLTQLHLDVSSTDSSPAASTSRTDLPSTSGIATTPNLRRRASNGPPPVRRRESYAYRDSSESSSSDDESLDFSTHMGLMRSSSRRWAPSSPTSVAEGTSVPEVHVLPPQSPPRPSAPPPPPQERPRSPPLPVILSAWSVPRGLAAGSGVSAAESSTWGYGSGAPYMSMLYDAGLRPRLGSHEILPNLTHRIQCWDMTTAQIPDISDAKACVVAPRCKIHNDASVALGGGLVAALLPNGLLAASLGVYSLRKGSLGQLLYTWSFGTNAISVSLSPMARYLVVGFASTRALFPSDREVVAQIFKLGSADVCALSSEDGSSGRGLLQHVGNMSQPGGTQPPVSLNSVRWLPRPGEGLIYGTNRGTLCICRPQKPILKEDNGKMQKKSGPTRDSTSPFVMLTDQVDQAARNTTIQVLSTASQTAVPQTQTTGTQTTLRGAGHLLQPTMAGPSSPQDGSTSQAAPLAQRFFTC
ncbi:activating molecule in BECN1-regulated autophagy protein 1-like isoform X2 [Ornithodoros turicata]|uniref:activating molecule in BECN1-regulated autophagy protein 1-like isoform X2 n=2 Tax=Ornithodoros turicata TaxID=34597 RepID=UPI0031391730